jgi:hypothetical protein
MNVMRVPHGRLIRATACLFALGLAACGGSSSKAASSTSTTGAGASTSASSQGSGTTAGGGNGSTTCNQLTKADVQPLLSQPITSVVVKPAGAKGEGQQCSFGLVDVSAAISVTVLPENDILQNYDGDIRSTAKPVSVPGIGDKAFRDGDHGSASITALKGDVYCSVAPQSDDMPGVAQLEDAAGNTSNIGDKAYSEIAAAAGTLCDRIYGSGNTTPDLTDLVAAGAAAASQPTTTTALTVPANFTLPTDGSPAP